MDKFLPGDLVGICVGKCASTIVSQDLNILAVIMIITVLAITYVAVQFHFRRIKNKQAIECIRNGAALSLAQAGLQISAINQNGKFGRPKIRYLRTVFRRTKIEVTNEFFGRYRPSRWLLYRESKE